ncbi:MAG: NUMOD3 domain-containing DNA-binding protein [Candidatus Paceibacterota bacterium]|jgi:hypothetical protein
MRHLSEETKRKMSEAKKLNPTRYWLGKHHSKETREKLSQNHKGKHPSKETREKRSQSLKDKKRSPFSKEWRKRMSESQKGKHLSGETRKKLSQSHKGEKHWNWQGGISFEPYSVDWTEDLKRAIRKRDKYTCQICGKEPAIIVHHIDYDKRNCNPDNLITLCESCHCKTNYNREYWINYFGLEKPPQ